MADARVFFALWPDPATATAISAAADTLTVDGWRVTSERLHLTLAFLGSVDSATVAALCRSAVTIRAAQFMLRLDRVGYFPRPGVAWIGPTDIPESLPDLATDVANLAGSSARGLPFRPHVSLAGRARRPDMGARFAPIEWCVREFCLIESGGDGVAGEYACLGRWPLGSDAGSMK